MEKENIITVDIEDFKDSQHVLDYIDDDFAIVNSLEGTPYSNDTIKLNCFLIAVCIEGCIQLDVLASADNPAGNLAVYVAADIDALACLYLVAAQEQSGVVVLLPFAASAVFQRFLLCR